MLKFLRKMLLLVLMMPLVTMAQGFNFTCDFEEDADAAAWSYVNNTTNKWCIGSGTHNGAGTKSLYISDDEGVTYRYALSGRAYSFAYHTMTLGLGTYDYSYDWKCVGEGPSWPGGSVYDYMRVALVPGSVDFVANENNGFTYNSLPNGWIPLDGDYALSQSSDWASKEGVVNITEAGDYKLVVYWVNDGNGGSSTPGAIDNISFTLPTCPKPASLAVTSVSNDSVTVSWVEAGEAISWIVTCVPSGAGLESSEAITETVSTTTCSLGGLEFNSLYDIYVQADCVSEQSVASMISFRSACGPIEVPYAENFEGYESGIFPYCWFHLGGDAEVTSYDGAKSLILLDGGVVASPKVPLDGNVISLDFMLQRDDYRSGQLQIGFVTDLANVDNMTLVKTINLENDNVYVECDADFSVMGDEAVEQGYIILKQVNHTAEYWALWIDDVNIRQLSDCRRPASMVASYVGYNSATLQWTAVEGATSYEVVYGRVNDPEDAQNIKVENLTSNSVDINNLEPETEYYIWVRNNCGAENSYWRAGHKFTTQLGCATVENVFVSNNSTQGVALSWSFNTLEGAPCTDVELGYRLKGSTDAYTTAHTTNSYYIFSGLQVGTSYEYYLKNSCGIYTSDSVKGTFSTASCGVEIAGGMNTCYQFPTSIYDNYSYTQMLYKADELGDVDSIRGVAFRYFNGDGTERTLDVYMGLTTANALSGSAPIQGSFLTKVATSATLTVNEGWCDIMFDSVFVYDGTSNIVVAINDKTGVYKYDKYYVYYHDGGVSLQDAGWTSFNPNSIYGMSEFQGVPDITFLTSCGANMCEAPLLTVNTVSSTEVSLVWAPGGSDTKWVVEYKANSAQDWTTHETTMQTSSTITNLQPGTFYDIRVGSVCGEDTLYNSVEAFTNCAAVSAPYVENFSGDVINPCITLGNSNGSASRPTLVDHSLNFGYTTHCYAVLPEFVDEVNTLRMTYTLYGEKDKKIVIAVGSDKDNWSTFVAIDTVKVIFDNTRENHVIYFNEYMGDGHYIAIQGITSGVKVDDIVVETIPTCAMPIDLTISNVTSTSADISWNGNTGSSDNWLVTWRNTTTNEVTEDMIAETSYTIDGLLSNAEYEVKVANLCGGDTIEALYPIMFRTECGIMQLPYTDGFESYEGGLFPSCWFSLAGDNIVEVGSYYAGEGEKSLEMENTIILSPKVPLAGNMIAVDFLMKYADAEAGSIVVGFTTDNLSVANMEVVDTITLTTNYQPYELTFDNINSAEEGYIVWKQVNSTTSGWRNKIYMDNVYIREKSDCVRPESVTITNVKHNSAVLTWNAVEGASEYEVMYGTVNSMDAPDNMIEMSSSNTFTITELEGSTTYYAWVRNNCGDNYSDWRKAGSFTTQISCASLANVEVTHATNSGIALSWTYDTEVGAPATEVELSWKTSADADYTTVIVPNTYYILEGLQPSTTYEFRLSTICSTDTAEAYTLSVTTDACGITIGDQTITSSNIPTQTNWNYYYSQMIYPAEEFVNIDTIKSISFSWSSEVRTTRNIDLYMGHVKRSTFTANQYVPADSLTLVASNVEYNLVDGWCEIVLNTPFAVHADSNIVIAFDDNTGSFAPGYQSKLFHVHPGSAIYTRSDDVNYNPTNLGRVIVDTWVPDILIPQPCDENMCTSPLLVVSNVTSHTASLAWGAGNEGDTWQVEYKLAADSVWTLANASVSDTFITISNLQPGSFYDFRVGILCEGALQYTAVRGFTDCAAVTAPYIENFNGMEDVNPCWIVGNIENSSRPYIYDDMLEMGYSANGYAILPEFTDDIATLHALFSVQANTAGAKVEVMVGEDPNNWGSFITIDTFTINETSVLVQQECSFADYAGEGHYIAFHSLSSSLVLDDITIEAIPSCGMPSNLAISNVSSNSATITWTGDTRMSDGWLIDYTVVGGSNIERRTVSATELTYTFSDLLPNTNYEVMVRNLCGVDTVAALSSITFRTECTEMVLPYLESFEMEIVGDYHACWFSTNSHSYGNEDDPQTAPIIEDMIGVHGQVLKFGDNVNMISPRVPIAGDQIKINFDAKVDDPNYAGKLVVGFTTSSSSVDNIEVVDTIQFTDTEWHNYEFSFTNLATTETGYVVFKNIDNTPYDSWWDVYYYSGYIDNVTFMVDNNCSRVTDASISNITSTSATVTFKDTTSTGSYTIAYSTVNNVNEGATFVDATDTTYTLTGLQPNTDYYVWIRNNCTVGAGAWVIAPMFHTACVAISELPYVENFDSYTEDIARGTTAPDTYPMHTLPDCWNFINMSTTKSSSPQVFLSNSSDFADSANCLFFRSRKNSSILAVLPEFTTHVGSLQISFEYRNEGVSNSNGKLQLGVMTDISDSNSFVMIQEYPQVSSLQTISHNFGLDDLNTATNYVIAFRYVGGTGSSFYLSIDNVVVEQAASCIIPEGLALSSIADTEATLSWNGTASSYHVQYRLDSVDTWIDMPIVATNFVTITGLNAQSTYEARVQAICGTTNSDWTDSILFTTMCGAYDVPFVENFDSYTEDIGTGVSTPSHYPNHFMPTCWAFPVMGSYSPKVYLSSNSGFAVTGNCLFFSSSDEMDVYAILPALNVPVDSLSISFTYVNEGTNSSNSPITVGVVTNPSDVSTFIALEDFAPQEEKTIAEHSFTLDDAILLDDVTYYIAIRYGHNDYGYYMGIDNVAVDYAPTCPRLAAPTIDSITSNSAIVNWGGNAANYELSYKASSASDWTTFTTTANTDTLTNLSVATDYEVRVRAICSATDTSDWSGVALFTTDCGVFQMPFIENFNATSGQIGNLLCWARYKGLLSGVQAGTDSLILTTNGWSSYGENYQVNNGGYSAHLDIYGTRTQYWLVSPMINLTIGANLSFDLARRDYENCSVWDADDKFVLLASTDEGTTWTELRTWAGTDYQNIPLYTATADSIEIDLHQYVGQNVQFAFYGESTIDSEADHYIYIDNIEVSSDIPTCAEPTNLIANDITATTANLSWEGSASAYEVEYRAQNETDWSNTIAVTASNYTLTALQPLTAYEWRVRSNCSGVIGNSEWVESTFTTLENPCVAPTNFTASVEGAVVTIDWEAAEGQNSWEVMLTTGDNAEGIRVVADEHPFTIDDLQPATYTAKVRAMCSAELYSDWSNSVEFTINSCAQVTNVAVSDITENSAILTWTAGADESAWEISYGVAGFDQEDGDVIEATTTTYTFTELTAATSYEVYVRAMCGNDFYSLWSDKVQFTTLEGQEGIDGVASDIHFTIYPNPTSGAATISLQGVEGKVTISIVDMNGRTISSEAIECGVDCEKRVDVAGLAQGTYFVRVLGDNLNSVRKLIVR